MILITNNDRVNKAIEADGSLFSLGWYLAYNIGDKDACLDGHFTPEELTAIADYMLATRKP